MNKSKSITKKLTHQIKSRLSIEKGDRIHFLKSINNKKKFKSKKHNKRKSTSIYKNKKNILSIKNKQVQNFKIKSKKSKFKVNQNKNISNQKNIFKTMKHLRRKSTFGFLEMASFKNSNNNKNLYKYDKNNDKINSIDMSKELYSLYNKKQSLNNKMSTKKPKMSIENKVHKNKISKKLSFLIKNSQKSFRSKSKHPFQ